MSKCPISPSLAVILMPIMPMKSKMTKIQVAGFNRSPNSSTPIRTVPTAPMPVQIGYARLMGSFAVALAKKPKLATIPIKVAIVQPIWVKPLLSFINVAHTISKIPAITK